MTAEDTARVCTGDLLTPYYGDTALGVALAYFSLAGLWGSVHFWLCGKALAKQQQDLE